MWWNGLNELITTASQILKLWQRFMRRAIVLATLQMRLQDIPLFDCLFCFNNLSLKIHPINVFNHTFLLSFL